MTPLDWFFVLLPLALLAVTILWAAWGELRDTDRALDLVAKAWDDKKAIDQCHQWPGREPKP